MFPWYLSIGMTWEQFWQGSPSLTVAYRKAHELQSKRVNLEQWRMGQYVVSALQVSVVNMFLKKGATPIEYPKQPFPLNQEELEQREMERQEQLEEKLKAQMMMWAAESQNKKEGG